MARVPRVTLATPGRQAEKSARTRARIVAAVVDCVEEHGFPGATSQRIAARAGVSVGAVQHHFPTKTDVLRAVLEDSYARLAAVFDAPPPENATLEERVALFVSRAWERYGSPSFRSTFEIVLSARSELAAADPDWARPVAESQRRARSLWRRFFGDLGLAAAREREILRFSFVCLAGLAMTLRLEEDPRAARRQLALLERSLVGLLTPDA